MAIGQGEVGLTPLQMANMCVVIANRGYYYTPHAIRKIEGSELDEKYLIKNKCTVETKYFSPVIEGMRLVYESGTARGSRIPGIEICGKTGTSQNPHGEDHSIFIAFAPRENPKIAISVIVENGGYGSRYAAPIASLMIEKYINPDSTSVRPDLMGRMLEANLMDKDE
jgi:penicillin-binding protein 2